MWKKQEIKINVVTVVLDGAVCGQATALSKHNEFTPNGQKHNTVTKGLISIHFKCGML